MPFKIHFWSDFDGFWEGKWSQVGTKIVLEIDVMLELQIFTKTYKNQWFFNDFGGFREASWVPKCIKNPFKILLQDEVRLGIDFSRF